MADEWSWERTEEKITACLQGVGFGLEPNYNEQLTQAAVGLWTEVPEDVRARWKEQHVDEYPELGQRRRKLHVYANLALGSLREIPGWVVAGNWEQVWSCAHFYVHMVVYLSVYINRDPDYVMSYLEALVDTGPDAFLEIASE